MVNKEPGGVGIRSEEEPVTVPHRPSNEVYFAELAQENERRVVEIRALIEKAQKKLVESGITPEEIGGSTLGQVFSIISKWLQIRELVYKKYGSAGSAEANTELRQHLRITGNSHNNPDHDLRLHLDFNRQLSITLQPSTNRIDLDGPQNGGDDYLMYASEEKYPEGGGYRGRFTTSQLDPSEMTDDQARQLKEILNILNDYLADMVHYYETPSNLRGYSNRPNFPAHELADARGEDEYSLNRLS